MEKATAFALSGQIAFRPKETTFFPATMRILVQHCKTALYLNENSEWVGSDSDALVFKGTAQALEHCMAKKMENVRIVLKFSNSAADVFLPVTSTGCQ